MSVKRLIFAAAMLLCPSVAPRMASSGVERWFVISVPGPERFNLDGHGSGIPAAMRKFGYPFVFYTQVGREFRTKSGRLLFWPSAYNPPWRSRFSPAALFGDIAASAGIAALLLLAAERRLPRIRPGQSKESEPQADSAPGNPYRAPASAGGE